MMLLKSVAEAEERGMIPATTAHQPEVLGTHYMQNRAVLQGVIGLLTQGGLSQEQALEVIRRSEDPRMKAKLMGALRQVLMAKYGLSLAMADKFIDTYGHDEYSAKDMAAAIERLPKGNRIGQTRVGLLPRSQSERRMSGPFLYRLSKLVEKVVDTVDIDEGRIDDARKTYVDTGKISAMEFSRLVVKDPARGKYIMWICKYFHLMTQGVSREHSQDFIDEQIDGFDVLREFEDMVRRGQIENKDIYSYAKLEDVEKEVVKHRGKMTKSQMKRGIKDLGELDPADIVHGPWDAKAIIVAPKTMERSIQYGRGAAWCTAAMGKNNLFDTYYRKQGNQLYYVYPLRKDGKYADEWERIALRILPDGSTAEIRNKKNDIIPENDLIQIFDVDLGIPRKNRKD